MFGVRSVTDNGSAMGGALLERIEELIDAPSPGEETVERTLTDGYAQALALEGERWRLHRRLGEAAADLDEDDRARAREVSALARRLAQTDVDLARLRERLAALRRRAQELRPEPFEPARQTSA
jgi:hypothetical protein